jgi:hypothetical protein
MKKLWIIFIIIPTIISGQPAKFYADTSRLRSFTGQSQEEFDRAMEFEWRINHRVLKFGSTLTNVEINKSGPDTILFRISHDHAWDTLVTKIPHGSINRFNYNSCCHYFNAITEDGHIIKGSVNFELSVSDSKVKKYLCSIDSYGTFISPSRSKTISAESRSPMLPNSYNVAIQEVKSCNGKKCQNTALFKEDGSEDPGYKFKTKRQVIVIHYVPLSTEPLFVNYDLDSAKIQIE